MYFNYDNSTKKYYLRIQYGSNNFLDLEYSYTKDENGVKFEYVQPKSEADGNVVNLIPSLQTFVQTFSGHYSVTSAETKFDMSNIRLVSDTDAEWWFNMTL